MSNSGFNSGETRGSVRQPQTSPPSPMVSISGTVAVSGGLTDTQLRASAVSVTFTNTSLAVTGPVTDAQLRASAVPVSGPLTDAQLRASSLIVTFTNAGLLVDGSGSIQPISAAALPLPVGAATVAKQPALGTAGYPSADVLTVQGNQWATGQPVCLPKSNPAEMSLAEHIDQLFAAQCAAVHLLTQVVALLRGRSDPLAGEEGDSLIGEYLDSRARFSSIVN